jgi:hypothetical protein
MILSLLLPQEINIDGGIHILVRTSTPISTHQTLQAGHRHVPLNGIAV